MAVRRGFDHLSGAGASLPRSVWVRSSLAGWLSGLLLSLAWAMLARSELEQLRADEARLKAELAQARQAHALAGQQGQRLQASREQQSRLQVAQQRWRQWLSVLEDLASSEGARLSELRLDGQGLQLQGHIDPAQLQTWALSRPASSWGMGPPQLVELTALAPGERERAARFVLRWPPQAAGGPP
jgi:hypothetical protein